jgi:hypothetical protein
MSHLKLQEWGAKIMMHRLELEMQEWQMMMPQKGLTPVVSTVNWTT